MREGRRDRKGRSVGRGRSQPGKRRPKDHTGQIQNRRPWGTVLVAAPHAKPLDSGRPRHLRSAKGPHIPAEYPDERNEKDGDEEEEEEVFFFFTRLSEGVFFISITRAVFPSRARPCRVIRRNASEGPAQGGRRNHYLHIRWALTHQRPERERRKQGREAQLLLNLHKEILKCVYL